MITLNSKATIVRLVLVCLIASVQRAGSEEIRLATDAPQPMSPENSKAQMRLPQGFRIELVASEPVVQEPSCIAFDHRGRIFVTELHGYNVEGEIDVAELNKTGKLDTAVRRLRWEIMGGKIAEAAQKRQFGKVKLLKDNDGDGKIDESVVWADDLPAVYGVVPTRDGIIVVAAPDIVFFADRDGDDEPDIRETLYTGFKKREMERGINNPRWGIDNWIYVGAGGHGGIITGPHLKQPVDLHHSDFRIKADGSAIEPVTGRVGTFGLTLNDAGDRFPCSGGEPAVYSLPMPYGLLTRNPYVAMPSTNHSAADYGRGFRISEPHPWRVRRRSDPAWIKFYGNRETDSNYFTGGCGGEIYTADLFPAEYHGNFFYCEPSLNIIHRCVLSRDGAGYQAKRALGEEESEFLASKDQWFRPMNLRVGPDGALYIIDMYREIIEDYSAIPRFLQQQYGLDKGRDKGRIWRLLPEDAVPAMPSQYATSIEAGLIGLSDPNMKNRLAAQRSIVSIVTNSADPKKAKQVAVKLIGIVVGMGSATARNSAVARLHALQTLAAIDGLDPTHLQAALGDDDYRVRLHALRLATGKQLNEAVAAKIQDMASVESMDVDPAVRLQLALTLGEFPSPAPHLANLAALHGDERWMIQAITSSASQCASELLQTLVKTKPIQDKALPLLQPLAVTIGAQRDRSAIRLLLAELPDVDSKVSIMCFTGLRQGLDRGQEPVDNILDEAEMESLVKRVLTPSRGKMDDFFQSATHVAAKLFPANSKAGAWLFGEMAKAAIHDSDSLKSRQFAIAVLNEAPLNILKEVIPKILDSRQSPTLQLAMVDSLSGSNDPEVAELLLARWKGYTPVVRKHVLSALLNRSHLATALLNAIEKGNTVRAADLSDSQKELLFSAQDPSVSERARALFSSRTTDAELAARIKNYEDALLEKRNPQHGRQVFANTCLNCHRLGKVGHEVGPALGSILNKPDEAILVDILDPSAKVDSEYTSYTVVTASGQVVAGVLTAESPTSIRLKMEKGETWDVLRNEIDVMKASDVSLMPSNLHEKIRPKAMADLLAYMREAYAARGEN